MTTVEQALELVLSDSLPQETEVVNLKNALGKVLAEQIKADRDAPPFDRVAMDGIAIYAASLNERSAFRIEKTQAAGAEQSRLMDIACCVEVMTGAILPAHTDCVIPYEQIEIKEGTAKIKNKDHLAGQHIHRQGTDAKRGDILVDRGRLINPAVIGMLASVWKTKIKVLKINEIS